MGVLRNIAVAVLAISVITFVALFGSLPALRKTPIGWLQRLLCIRIPNGLKRLDVQVTGGHLSSKSKRLGQYLFYEKNPVVLILFLLLFTGASILFLWNALSELPARLIIPIPVLVFLPYLFTWLCAANKAHHVTPASHQLRLHDYPYDHVLYQPNKVCWTCHLTKPARSKHCSLCGVCIAKCDHHCPWINNCVGVGNYHYFMALLLSLGLVEIYGAYLCWWILRPLLKTNSSHAFFSGAYWEDVLDVVVIAVNEGGLSIAGVGMLTAATAALPLGLFAYHCYLIWAGMTTNEAQKWSDWREDIADGIVFKASRKALESHNSLRKYGDRPASQANGDMNAALSEDDPVVPWPVDCDQVLVRTNDARPPHGQEALWTRIWSLADVENLYDLGGWDNFMEVMTGR